MYLLSEGFWHFWWGWCFFDPTHLPLECLGCMFMLSVIQIRINRFCNVSHTQQACNWDDKNRVEVTQMCLQWYTHTYTYTPHTLFTYMTLICSGPHTPCSTEGVTTLQYSSLCLVAAIQSTWGTGGLGHCGEVKIDMVGHENKVI